MKAVIPLATIDVCFRRSICRPQIIRKLYLQSAYFVNIYPFYLSDGYCPPCEEKNSKRFRFKKFCRRQAGKWKSRLYSEKKAKLHTSFSEKSHLFHLYWLLHLRAKFVSGTKEVANRIENLKRSVPELTLTRRMTERRFPI